METLRRGCPPAGSQTRTSSEAGVGGGGGAMGESGVFDPELVVIGGGVSQAGGLLLDPATAKAKELIIEGVGTETRIELARYGPRAGVRGAALLAGQELDRDSLA